MSNTVARLTRCVPYALIGLTSLFAGCDGGPDSMAMVRQTKESWATDPYVGTSEDRGQDRHAARVLDQPERAKERVMQVGSTTVLVHVEPDAASRVIGRLSYPDAVTVVAECDYIRRTGTSQMDEYVKDGDYTPTWCKLKLKGGKEGWVPARALVDPEHLAQGSEARARERLRTLDGGGGKGFSEKVKREAKAVKGFAGGSGASSRANYEAADALIARAGNPVMAAPSARPFAVQPRASAVPDVGGQSLMEVDPAVARAAEAKTQAAISLDGFGGEAGVLLDIGARLGGEDAKNLKKALEIVAKLCECAPPTAFEERIIGRESLAMTPGIDRALPPDHPVSNYVSWLGARVAGLSSSAYPALGLEFIVLDDPEINAVAIPGGVILITTGMLNFLEGEHELAAILGHEITHVEERQAIKRSKDLQIMVAAFDLIESNDIIERFLRKSLSDLPPVIMDLVLAELQKLVDEWPAKALADAQQPGDQGQETAADLRGMSLCCAGGWDPHALTPILVRLKERNNNYGGASYSETRLDDSQAVVDLLPCTGTTPENGTVDAPAPGAQARWAKLDELLAQ